MRNVKTFCHLLKNKIIIEQIYFLGIFSCDNLAIVVGVVIIVDSADSNNDVVVAVVVSA